MVAFCSFSITISSVTAKFRDLEKYIGSLADEETQISDIYKKVNCEL